MLTVYKYGIPATLGVAGARFSSEFELTIPNPGIVTKMGMQESRSSQFQVWALVDPDGLVRTRKFVFLGTGHETKHKNLMFIDAWITDGLVFHLFEVLK